MIDEFMHSCWPLVFLHALATLVISPPLGPPVHSRSNLVLFRAMRSVLPDKISLVDPNLMFDDFVITSSLGVILIKAFCHP